MNAFFAVDQLTVNISDITLLSNISFQLNDGDYLCIVGPNGSGKSSLLKAIVGINPITSGDIRIKQIPTHKLNQKTLAQHISYVPQAHKHALFFTTQEFIKMSRYPYHSLFSVWSKEDQSAFERAIEITHTEKFLNRHMQTLSGGELQRVMIAAALCQQTPLLLLDEPTSFLDPHHQVEVHHLINTLNQQHNISIIEVSHDLNHAVQHSQHILALKHGRTQWQGDAADFSTADTLYQLYDQDFVFTSHPQTGARIALPSEQQ